MSETTVELFPLTGARMVPVRMIQPGRYQPRKRFDDQAMQEITASVIEHGVLEPVLLRPIGKDRFELVAGERRWRAAVAAHLEDIPAWVKELTLEQVLAQQMIENVQRESLHPLEEAKGYDLLIHPPEDLKPKTVAEVAHIYSKSVSYVRKALALLNLIPAAADAFLADHISLTTARAIARMPIGVQDKALPKILGTRADDSKQVAHADAERVLATAYMLRLANASFPIKDDTLVPSAGGCHVCPKRTGANPDLFADIPDQDTCTDPDCHTSKVEAHNTRRKALATEGGIQVIEGKAASALLKFGPDSTALNADYVYMDEPLADLTGSKSSLAKLLGTLLTPSALFEHPRDKTLREIVHTDKARNVLRDQGLLLQRSAKGEASALVAAPSPAGKRESPAKATAPTVDASAERDRRRQQAEEIERRLTAERSWRFELVRQISAEMMDGDVTPLLLQREAAADYGAGYIDDNTWPLLCDIWGWEEGSDWNRTQGPRERLLNATESMHQGQLVMLISQLAMLADLSPNEHDLDDDPSALLIARVTMDTEALLDVSWRAARDAAIHPAGQGRGKKTKVSKAKTVPSTDESAPYPTNEPTPAGEQKQAPEGGEPGKPDSPQDHEQAPSAQGQEGLKSDLPHWVGQMVKVKTAKRVGEVVALHPDGSFDVNVHSWRTGKPNVNRCTSFDVTVLPDQLRPAAGEA